MIAVEQEARRLDELIDLTHEVDFATWKSFVKPFMKFGKFGKLVKYGKRFLVLSNTNCNKSNNLMDGGLIVPLQPFDLNPCQPKTHIRF